MVRKRRRHKAAFKFRVALEALEGNKTIRQLSTEHEIRPSQIRAWKRQLLEKGPGVFAGAAGNNWRERQSHAAELQQQVSRLKMELEWLKEKVAPTDP